MSSFNIVNYSVRPNKHIQRSLVFEGYRDLRDRLSLGSVRYIGLGSIWFSDFVMAHRDLHIEHMVSIENDEIGYSRANFNKPFKCVEVINEMSTDALKLLCDDKGYSDRPWFVWLDYDGSFDETVSEDIQIVVERAPTNTALVITFNADQRKYGKPRARPNRIKSLFGDVAPDNLTKEECEGKKLPGLLADLAIDRMKSVAASTCRPGGFMPCFRVIYGDGADMVTVGGILPAPGCVPSVNEATSSKSWPSCPNIAVATPPLTIREVSVLQAQLPRHRKLTRTSIKRLGFDLAEEQVEAFERFYKYYPVYGQVGV